MRELAEYLHAATRDSLEAIQDEERGDIYVVSLFVYDEDDDPRRPTVTVGFNTETQVTTSREQEQSFLDGLGPEYEFLRGTGDEEQGEARWNYAYYLQNRLAVVCSTESDPDGAALREAWVRSEGLWYDLSEGEDAVFNERGEPLTAAFVSLLEGVVRRLHAGDIERIFGRSVPVLIHELEYYDEIAEQNLRANPAGVADEFASWCRAE